MNAGITARYCIRPGRVLTATGTREVHAHQIADAYKVPLVECIVDDPRLHRRPAVPAGLPILGPIVGERIQFTS